MEKIFPSQIFQKVWGKKLILHSFWKIQLFLVILSWIIWKQITFYLLFKYSKIHKQLEFISHKKLIQFGWQKMAIYQKTSPERKHLEVHKIHYSGWVCWVIEWSKTTQSRFTFFISIFKILFTTCSEYGAHDFFSNSVRCMFSEASCYVEFKTLFS